MRRSLRVPQTNWVIVLNGNWQLTTEAMISCLDSFSTFIHALTWPNETIILIVGHTHTYTHIQIHLNLLPRLYLRTLQSILPPQRPEISLEFIIEDIHRLLFCIREHKTMHFIMWNYLRDNYITIKDQNKIDRLILDYRSIKYMISDRCDATFTPNKSHWHVWGDCIQFSRMTMHKIEPCQS